MTKTVIADYIGQPDLGYVLLALPSENFTHHVHALLDELSAELPGIIWPMPPEQLRITLCEIIQPKAYAQGKDALFMLPHGQYENAPADILSKVPTFTIRSSKLFLWHKRDSIIMLI